MRMFIANEKASGRVCSVIRDNMDIHVSVSGRRNEPKENEKKNNLRGLILDIAIFARIHRLIHGRAKTFELYIRWQRMFVTYVQ